LQIEDCKLQNADCRFWIDQSLYFSEVPHGDGWQQRRFEAFPKQLEERFIDFGARVGKVVDALPDTRLGRHIAGQLVRSGTSPAPNYAEACGAESRRDFVHKLNICLKELRESRCWLKLILRAQLLPEKKLRSICDECEQLISIVVKSLVTAKSNAKPRHVR